MTESPVSTHRIVPDNSGEFLFYRSEDGRTRVQVRIAEESVWLTQAGMAELYQTTPQNITLHIRNIYKEDELDLDSTCKEYLQVQEEGRRSVERSLKFYNLEMILAVGYRVRSRRGTQFRQWATSILREYLVKGFAMDDERLKAGRNLGQDYFDELLERIRDIRSSERRFYQKITDIYATSVDYDPRADETKRFFATVQNKLHWAIHGHTAPELIQKRADAKQPNMGLTTWKNAPNGPVRSGDISIAKNYLKEDEVRELNRIVTQYLDFAEGMAERRKTMTMEEWRERLDAFLTLNECDILQDAGRISKQLAESHAKHEYVQFLQERQRLNDVPQSDFDRFVAKTKQLSEKKNQD